MAQVRTICTGTKIVLTDGREFLIVEVAIDCPACGPHTLRVAGHHLRAIRDGLIELIDQYPELCGPQETQVLERLRFDGPGPSDPNTN